MAFWESMTMRPLDWLELKGFSMRMTPGTWAMASSTDAAASWRESRSLDSRTTSLLLLLIMELMSMVPVGETDTSMSGMLPNWLVYSTTASSLERPQLLTA